MNFIDESLPSEKIKRIFSSWANTNSNMDSCTTHVLITLPSCLPLLPICSHLNGHIPPYGVVVEHEQHDQRWKIAHEINFRVSVCVCSCLSVSLFLSRYIYACIWHFLCPQSPPRPFAPLTLADSFVCICAPCVYWAVVYFFFLLFFNSSSAAVTQKPWLRNGISKYFPHTHTHRISTLANGVPVCAIVLFSLPSHHISYGTNACISCV